ncbi:YeeE/YedE thiosulfate transporter family protein [Flavobacteriaceae bacterium]|jgi:uncharacterized membrane protein YedE/YeeE|nr:YeeE/YedE thiosulfate transporter family protein [Flavobacteriaceae bacterium]MDB4147993.1 YeeE/YedE thiosulfate transporter family protein [bacterium]MDA7716273.1 YeeE/YedE thiosulfate transporter family protein [Flavobacteriaceae bacterium]MDA7731239.1 YeeE/YedE thiosulfate transporter family protein [Flavobacteriaceae bacterium]MDA8734083.1 YeeE/YedE thiosulfate transporter family protein [Flavobacteriaceae bacterium]
MKQIKFLFIGTLFGIIMTKSEVISWFRIQEMFRFQSFHMYGIIGSAIITGLILVKTIKRNKLKTIYGDSIKFNDKKLSIPRYLFGGIIFGLGWALTGACPGPMFIMIGHGYAVFLILILSALLGTYVYGLIQHKLPH